jgi:cell division protein FtsQ
MSRWMNTLSYGLFWVWLALLVGHGLAFGLSRPRFALQHIRLQGDLTHIQEASIRASVLTRLSGNFFTLDLQKARRAFETLPWIKTAIVKRSFPNGLVVTLQEHQAVAYWQAHTGHESDANVNANVNANLNSNTNTSGHTQWIDAQGEVFETPSDEDVQAPKDLFKDFPVLSGPTDSAQQVWQFYGQLRTTLEKMPAQLHVLSLTRHGSWRAQLALPVAPHKPHAHAPLAWMELGVGSPEELLPKVQRLVSTWASATPQASMTPSAQMNPKNRMVASIDLRHHDGYALRWQDN